MLHTKFGHDRQSNTLEAVYMTDHNEHGVRASNHQDHSWLKIYISEDILTVCKISYLFFEFKMLIYKVQNINHD